MLDPIRRFGLLLERAIETGIPEPTAMALATADTAGRPSVRMVLLKDFDADGFAFYTNRESRKGMELAENPWAALCFHWQTLEAQVRVEGRVEAVSTSEADAYFASRGRGSQVGAWASIQSRPLETPDRLHERVAEIEARFVGRAIPRPGYWSGYRVRPERLEFWTGRPDRLHEREVYIQGPRGDWRLELLYP